VVGFVFCSSFWGVVFSSFFSFVFLGSLVCFGFSMIFMFIWTISSVMTLPRIVLRCLAPSSGGMNPTPPLRTILRRTPPWTLGLMGKPSLSQPPVIWALFPGCSIIEPSIISPIFLPMSGAARASSSSTALDVPACGSETITLNFVIVAELSSSAMKVGRLSIKSCAF